MDNEKYLQSVLDKREKYKGTDGDYSFLISGVILGGVPLIKIKGLTKEAARKMFDIFDENNVLFTIECRVRVFYKIQIFDANGVEVDVNYLPNTFTEYEVNK